MLNSSWSSKKPNPAERVTQNKAEINFFFQPSDQLLPIRFPVFFFLVRGSAFFGQLHAEILFSLFLPFHPLRIRAQFCTFIAGERRGIGQKYENGFQEGFLFAGCRSPALHSSSCSRSVHLRCGFHLFFPIFVFFSLWLRNAWTH